MTGIDVQKRHRKFRRAKRFFREAKQADRILAAGKKQRGPLKLGRDFAHHVDGFRFEILQMIEMITAHRTRGESSDLAVYGIEVQGFNP